MENGLNSPRGSNIFAEIFSNDLFVAGSDLAWLHNSEKLNSNWSEVVFQMIPSTLTVLLLALIDGPVTVFAYDSSSSVTDFVVVEEVTWVTLSLENFFCRSFEFVFHFRRLNAPLYIICLACVDNSSASWSLAAPVTRSSTYREFFNSSINWGSNSFCLSKWWRIVEPNIAGDGLSPNTSRVNRNCNSSEFSLFGSLSHKKRNISLSALDIATIRKAFSISAVRPMWCHLNLISVSNSCGVKFGPVSRQSFNE